MIGKTNFIKKLVGMNIFQWSIILFFVSLGAKQGATIPIVLSEHSPEHGETFARQAIQYVNPLPHVLMLTAIVVGVGHHWRGPRSSPPIYRRYGTLEEGDLLERIRSL